ncbi:MAG: hypothetical protein ACE5NP_12455, partial [Anaerolineae bacterium]
MERNKRTVSRREFLRMLASLSGLLAASSLLEACAALGEATPTGEAAKLPTPSPSTKPTIAAPTATVAPEPIPMKEVEMTKVAFVKTEDRAEGVGRALDLLGLNPV